MWFLWYDAPHRSVVRDRLWPARVAARKGHSFFGFFSQPHLLPAGVDRGLHGPGPHLSWLERTAPAPRQVTREPVARAAGPGVS